ncbi:host cell division inhibitor Icd-like protein [Escherichia coli]|uniref:host cell division inhibitor Icd-like protein n=1 Tax=Citrobacter portucalensis TaxID=1639133 RepID=UPI001BD4910E|nr:host cell division inhibitor Icd-like protein [Citrobacter portucalensis]ELN3541877.1 host cell division inhibitor Icd-like protein [Escherichia coli]ELN3546888.1 host cell division inhibitor Icd-like protein [Escherichia coli]ELN3561204.1 host cell division inhibitor Icd-like protein [Escherichia coli]ELN3571098.1 host cell division inhibitor Icd-like protein [Escherichia coli]
MAKPQCNQTHPKNRVFIFLALNRADMHSRPHREVITAVSEREARKLLVDRFILVFAGCLPAKEIYHG